MTRVVAGSKYSIFNRMTAKMMIKEYGMVVVVSPAVPSLDDNKAPLVKMAIIMAPAENMK